MVDVWLPYGRTEVRVRISSENLMEIAEVREKPGIKDLTYETEKIARGLVSSEKMAEIIRAGGKITLALNVSDASLAKLIVSSIVREIAHSGLKSENLTVVLANNPFTLRTLAAEHLRREIEPLGINVVVHDHSRDNRHICDAEDGVRIYLNKAFSEADFKILVSAVEPDPYILYNCCESGAAFGLTGLETIRDILAPILNADDIQERVFREALEVSRMAKVDFSISIIRNLSGDVVGCFAGEPEKVLHESLSAADSLYKVALKGEPNIIIISPGGSPLDIDIFNACRCLENALKVVRGDGIIVLVAECSEGYGKMEIQQMIKRSSGDSDLLESILRSEFSIDGFIAYRFLRALKKAEIIMSTAMPDYYASIIPRLKIFRTANAALDYALSKLGARAKVTVIPHGNFIIPALEDRNNL
ncbi:MAG: lactate racemase domain-containing protein [Candidatus Bathyarchaeia archaeon]